MAELISIPVKQIQPLVWKAGTLIQAMSAFISRFRTWAQIRSMLNSEWMCVCVTLRSICPLLIVWKNALYFPAVAQNDLHLDSGALGNLPEGNGIWVASHPVHWSAHEKRLECNRLNLSQPSCDFFLKIIPSAFKSEFHVCATKLGDWLAHMNLALILEHNVSAVLYPSISPALVFRMRCICKRSHSSSSAGARMLLDPFPDSFAYAGWRPSPSWHKRNMLKKPTLLKTGSLKKTGCGRERNPAFCRLIVSWESLYWVGTFE